MVVLIGARWATGRAGGGWEKGVSAVCEWGAVKEKREGWGGQAHSRTRCRGVLGMPRAIVRGSSLAASLLRATSSTWRVSEACVCLLGVAVTLVMVARVAKARVVRVTDCRAAGGASNQENRACARDRVRLSESWQASGEGGCTVASRLCVWALAD
eukprot:5364537-Pleurochrysis_carterae.AAC.1